MKNFLRNADDYTNSENLEYLYPLYDRACMARTDAVRLAPFLGLDEGLSIIFCADELQTFVEKRLEHVATLLREADYPNLIGDTYES